MKKSNAVSVTSTLTTGPWALGRIVAPSPLPISPTTNKPMYSHGAVRDVCELCARPNGATVAEIKRAMNSDVALYPITRHAGPAGRCGWRPNVTVDGKPGLPDIATLADTSRVAIVSFVGVDSLVNGRNPRSRPGNVTAVLAGRSAQSSDVPASKPAGTIPLASLPAKTIVAVVDAKTKSAKRTGK